MEKEENPMFFSIAEQTEEILEEIFLSGFYSVTTSTIKRIEELTSVYHQCGMEEGEELLSDLREQLFRCQESFSHNTEQTMEAFARIEFFLSIQTS